MSVDTKLTAIADEVRELSGATGKLGLDAMATNLGNANTEVDNQASLLEQAIVLLEGKAVTGDAKLQAKTVTPSESSQVVTADSGYNGLSSVSVGAISKTYVGSNVTKKAAQTYTPGTSNQTISSGQYLNGTQTILGDTDLVAGNIKKGVSIFNVTGTYEGSGGVTLPTLSNPAVDSNILSGYEVIDGSGNKLTGTMTNQGAMSGNITSKTQSITIKQGYHSGSGKVGISSTEQNKIIASNIKSGVSILGVTGTYEGTGGIDTSDATAVATDIASGKTAYVNGQKVTGSVTTYDQYVGWAGRPPALSGSALELSIKDLTPYMFRQGFYLSTPLTNLGNATAADVVKGKTFTSTSGIKVTGTHEDSGVTLPTLTSEGTAANLLYGKQLINSSGQVVAGTMTNNGAVTGTISTKAGTYTVPAGYHSGSGKVSISSTEQNKIIASNIKSGVSILGVTGTYSGTGGLDTSDATATANDVIESKTAYSKGQKITGSIPVIYENQHLDSGVLWDSSKNAVQTYFKPNNRTCIENGVMMYLDMDAYQFGNATTADVAKGKTFTSTAGLKLTGTMVGLPSGITSIATGVITPSSDTQTLNITHGLTSSNFSFIVNTKDSINVSDYTSANNCISQFTSRCNITYGNKVAKFFSISAYTNASSGSVTTMSTYSDDDTIFEGTAILFYSPYSYFKAGETYRWVVGYANDI